MPKIAIIDDDLAMSVLAEGLSHRGHDVIRVTSGAEAMKQIDTLLACDLIVLDILMPLPEAKADEPPENVAASGMQFLLAVRKRNSTFPVIVLSATQDNSIIESLKDDSFTTFISKWDSHPIREIHGIINTRLGISKTTPTPRPFIVHGQDEKTKYAVKNYLQNTLHLAEPIILHEQPSLGRTIFEKFEETAAESDLVFVLLTPDDQGGIVGETNDQKRRARQNVIFEMGYFLGVLGRRSGRVLLLYSGPLELPSDLSGVVYIDISQGIESASEIIRRELAYVLA